MCKVTLIIIFQRFLQQSLIIMIESSVWCSDSTRLIRLVTAQLIINLFIDYQGYTET